MPTHVTFAFSEKSVRESQDLDNMILLLAPIALCIISIAAVFMSESVARAVELLGQF